MKWNQEQMEAIYTTNQNILVSASAGAGKTSLLVERLLTLSTREENPIDLNKIVAMTFTDAAAAEMKKRLSLALSEKLKSENVNKDQIKKQLIYLNTAQISTIHSFCLNIIKKYYNVINLNPDTVNNNLEENVIIKIQQEAFLNALKIYQKNHDVYNLTKIFSTKILNLNPLQEKVIKIMKTANASFDTDLWYKETIEAYKNIKTIKEIHPKYLNLFFKSIILKYEVIFEFLKEARAEYILVQNELKHDDTPTFNLIEHYLNNVINALNRQDYESFYNNAKKLKEIKFKNRIKLPIALKSSEDLLLSHLKAIDTYPSNEALIKANNDIILIIQQLTDLAKLTNEEIKKIKTKINGFDFDDMEYYAYQILKANNNMIGEELKNEYEEILIDEFQDTNEIQNEIIKLISRDNNVFRVGDVKQSIYRFRKAKPEIMRDMMKDGNNKLISLRYNYRSKENIVQFTNHLFNKIMNIEGFSDVYQAIDNVAIGTQEQKKVIKDSIKFYALAIEDEKNELKSNELKAHFIADKITEMVKKGYNYNDFAILSRAHAPKRYLKKAFDKYNIPYFIDDKSGFSNSWMSLIITSFLKLCLNISDEIALAAVLTSPIYNYSDENLAEMVLKHGCLSMAVIEENLAVLNDIKKIRSLKSISLMLDNIALINDFINEKCNIQQRTNFDMYYEKALNFEKKSQDLQKFINLINITDNDNTGEAITVGNDDNVVRTMTIHHSKGLQFKVVFLWGQTRSNNQDDFISDANYGIAFTYPDTKYYQIQNTVHHIALTHHEKLESTQEYIRLLYVALTRAQNEMYIVDTVKSKHHLIKYDISTQINNCERISNTLLQSLENSELFKIEYIDTFSVTAKNQTIKKRNFNKIQKYQADIKELEIITPSKDSHELNLELDYLRNKESFKRGSLMHEYMEILPDKIWDENDTKIIKGLNKKEIQSLLNFNTSTLFRQALSMNIYHEFTFIYKENNQIINGIIDFMAIDNEKIIIVDFKSDRYVNEEELISLYKKQILFYKEALTKIYPHHQITSYIYSFNLNKAILIKKFT